MATSTRAPMLRTEPPSPPAPGDGAHHAGGVDTRWQTVAADALCAPVQPACRGSAAVLRGELVQVRIDADRVFLGLRRVWFAGAQMQDTTCSCARALLEPGARPQVQLTLDARSRVVCVELTAPVAAPE